MELQNLKVSTRETRGKGPAGRIRAAGEVPGVLYGNGKDPLALSVNRKVFEHLVHGKFGEHAVVQLDVEGHPEWNSPALLKSVQHHPVSEEILHADFLRIRLDQRIQTLVPLNLVGHARGVVEGGIVEALLRQVEVECLALEVPASIDIDITDMGIGDIVHVAQLTVPEEVTVMTDPERPVVSIHMPRVVAAVEEEAVVEGEGEAGEGTETAAEGEGEAE